MSKISLLPAATALTGSEIFPALQGGVNVRDTLNNIKSFILNGVPNTGTSGEIKITGTVISFDGTIAASKTEAKIKGSVIASAGAIPFGDGNADTVLSDSQFTYNRVDKRLAVGTALTNSGLSVKGSTVNDSSLNIGVGVAPTLPQDGDMWYDGTDIFIQVGVATKKFTLV